MRFLKLGCPGGARPSLCLSFLVFKWRKAKVAPGAGVRSTYPRPWTLGSLGSGQAHTAWAQEEAQEQEGRKRLLPSILGASVLCPRFP